MNEHDLMDALEDHAADLAVGPAPLDAMTRSAARTRGRRALVGGVAVAAVLAVGAVGLVQVLPSDSGDADGSNVAVQPGETDVPPDGFVYVGLGRAAIAVPEEWRRDDVGCNGTPEASTYTADTAGRIVCDMYSPFPADTDLVAVDPILEYVDTSTWTPTAVDGVDALRSPTGTSEPDPTFDAPAVTTAYVAVPSLGVLFTASSTIDPARVDELLARATVLDGHVGVPGFSDLQSYEPDAPRMDDGYLPRLEDAGLEVELVDQTDRASYPPGTVIAVDPLPGTVLAPGATVRVTVAQ